MFFNITSLRRRRFYYECNFFEIYFFSFLIIFKSYLYTIYVILFIFHPLFCHSCYKQDFGSHLDYIEYEYVWKYIIRDNALLVQSIFRLFSEHFHNEIYHPISNINFMLLFFSLHMTLNFYLLMIYLNKQNALNNISRMNRNLLKTMKI